MAALEESLAAVKGEPLGRRRSATAPRRKTAPSARKRDDQPPSPAPKTSKSQIEIAKQGQSREVEVDGHRLELTNLDKVLWPEGRVHQGRGDRLLRADRRRDPPPPARPAADPEALSRTASRRSASSRSAAPSTRPTGSQTAPIESGRDEGDIDFCVCDDRADPDLDGAARGARAAPVAVARRRAPSARPCSPSTSTRARRRPSSSAAGSALRLRELFGEPRPRVLPEDLGLEGDPGLRAAQHRGHLRADQALRPRRRPGARARRARPGRLEDDQEAAQGQGARRLEPERPAKTTVAVYSLRARERPTVSTPADLGGGRATLAERRRPGRAALRGGRGARAGRASTATCSRRCSSSSRSCRSAPSCVEPASVERLADDRAGGSPRPRRGGGPGSCRARSRAISGSRSASARISLDRLGERVERLPRLGLGRLDHQRLVDEQREVDRRRVEAEVEQALGDVERLHPELALRRRAGEDELVHAGAVEGERQVLAGAALAAAARAGSWRSAPRSPRPRRGRRRRGCDVGVGADEDAEVALEAAQPADRLRPLVVEVEARARRRWRPRARTIRGTGRNGSIRSETAIGPAPGPAAAVRLARTTCGG